MDWSAFFTEILTGQINHRFNEIELRLVVKLGLITVSTTTATIAILTWMMKLK